MTKPRNIADIDTAKLTGIETAATADQTAEEIRDLYRSIVPDLFTFTTVTANAYTIVPADLLADEVKQMAPVGAAVVTVPLNNPGDPFIVGKSVSIRRKNTEAVSIASEVGVTLESPEDYVDLRSQFSLCTLLYQGDDTWMLYGDLA